MVRFYWLLEGREYGTWYAQAGLSMQSVCLGIRNVCLPPCRVRTIQERVGGYRREGSDTGPEQMQRAEMPWDEVWPWWFAGHK